MRVLVVLPFAPWPVRVRSANLWPRIGRRAEVHAVFQQTGLPQGKRPTLLDHVASHEALPASRARSLLRAAGALASGDSLRAAWQRDDAAARAVEAAYARVRPDIVYAERLRALPLVARLPLDRVVLDPTDSLPLFYETVAHEPGAPLLQRVISTVERPRLVALERRMYPRLARVVACSQRDAEAMMRSAPDARIEVIANGVDLRRFRPAAPHRNGGPKVLMSGNFGYWPNSEAARWLLGRAGTVRERWGGEIVFAGANPPRYLRRAERRASVTTAGYVHDMTEQYHHASVVVAPVRFAVGTQNKVIEALACARPVVATPQCAAGLEPGGRDCVVEARRDSFVEALGAVLGDEDGQRLRAAHGRAYIEQHHDWDAIAQQMLAVLEAAAAG